MSAIDVATTLACSLIPAFVCTAAGAAVGRGAGRLPGADMLVGFGLVGGALTILAVTTRVPLSTLMLGIAALALLAPPAQLWLGRRSLPGGLATWIALALVIPLLVRAASMQAALWDEFWHWLPSASFAYMYDALARPDLPRSFSQFPGYPQAMPLVIAATSFLAGRFLEGAGPVMNVALVAAFCALLADTLVLVRRHQSLETPPLAKMALIAGCVAVVAVLNPGLDGEVVLSSYADAATMIMVGALGLLGVEWLARLAGRSTADPAEIAWRFGFVAAALINLKQSNPVLLALLAAGLGLIVLSDRNIRLRRALASVPQLLGPAAVVYLAWRWYVAANLPSGDVHFRPIASWSFAALPATLEAIFGYIRDRPLFHGGVWLVVAAGLLALPALRHRGGEARWLAVLTAVVWLGYNLFLLIVYLGAFSEEEAHSAADYWRYTPHVALLALSAPIVALARVNLTGLVPRTAIAACCAAIAVAAPLLRSDLGITRDKRWSQFVRGVAADLKSVLPPGAGLVLVLSFNPNPFPIIIRYDLWQFGDPARAIYPVIVWDGEDLGRVDDLVKRGEAQYLILHDGQWPADELAARFGVAPLNRELILFTWQGRWERMKSWPIPAAVLNRPT